MVPEPARTILRLEGAAVLVGAVWAYAATGVSWWLFAALALAPDLALVAYLAGPRVGGAVYNLAHTYTAPLALAGAGLALDAPLALAVALVWLAHVGIDRAIGYGLKLPPGWRDTHLGPAGPATRRWSGEEGA